MGPFTDGAAAQKYLEKENYEPMPGTVFYWQPRRICMRCIKEATECKCQVKHFFPPDFEAVIEKLTQPH